jgi:hypothetical protein
MQITKELGFQYQVPKISEASLREVISSFETVGIWPKGTLKA